MGWGGRGSLTQLWTPPACAVRPQGKEDKSPRYDVVCPVDRRYRIVGVIPARECLARGEASHPSSAGQPSGISPAEDRARDRPLGAGVGLRSTSACTPGGGYSPTGPRARCSPPAMGRPPLPCPAALRRQPLFRKRGSRGGAMAIESRWHSPCPGPVSPCGDPRVSPRFNRLRVRTPRGAGVGERIGRWPVVRQRL